MSQLDLLLQALHRDPGDTTAWLTLADALEESGQVERAELTRLLSPAWEKTTIDIRGR
jgi:uncharacterized protein (TIGR02996 family)